MIGKIWTLLIAYCLGLSGLWSQSHTLYFGGGFTSEALRDQGFSPMMFSGTGMRGIAGLERSKARKNSIWLLQYSSFNTQNQFGRNLAVTSGGISNFNFYGLEEQRWQWGWSHMSVLHHRFIDGFSNFNGRTDMFATFGVNGKYTRPFAFRGRQFSIRVVAHTQLLGFYLPSGYTASLPKGWGYESNNWLSGFWTSSYLFYPGAAWNMGLWPALQWHLKTGNTIQLLYLYDFVQLSEAQLMTRSTGTWFITFNMRLK
jgi:hypothetical protein